MSKSNLATAISCKGYEGFLWANFERDVEVRRLLKRLMRTKRGQAVLVKYLTLAYEAGLDEARERLKRD